MGRCGHLNGRFREGYRIPTKLIKGFLNSFGHLIKELYWEASGTSSINTELLEAIVHFCSKTLTILSIQSLYFGMLHRLTLTKTVLRELHLKNVDTLTNEGLALFLSLNPQLKQLTLDACLQLNRSILKEIARYIPNIESLRFEEDICSTNRYRDGEVTNDLAPFEEIGKLKNLRHLGLGDYVPLKTIAEILDKNEVPVDQLDFKMYNTELSAHMPRLKIKKLKIERIELIADQLIDLLIALPILEDLDTTNLFINLSVIKTALLHGEHLTKFSFHSNILETTLDEQVIVLDDGRKCKIEVTQITSRAPIYTFRFLTRD